MALKFERLLQFGMQGADVSRLQLALKDVGYNLTGTGFFGNSTDSAVRAFQRSANLLPVDGKVGTNTIDALNAKLPVPAKGTIPPAGGSAPVAVQRPLWLEEGLALVGTKETPGAGDNPVIIEWAHELGGSIAENYTHDSIPWCMLFQAHILAKAGQKSPDTLWALDMAKYGQKLSGPAVGALACMVRSGGGHVICVVGRDRNGNIVGVGGNQSDAVSVRSFPKDRIVSYNWPPTAALPTEVGFDKLPLVNSAGVSIKED